MMENKDFTYTFETPENREKIFAGLMRVNEWWTGFFAENIEGKNENINDEFTFRAGDGAHYSRQRLVEIIPDSRMVWKVTDSHLSFLTHTNEWNGTRFGFEIFSNGNKTQITFTHQGLVPQIECYEACTSAWMQYLKKLEKKLNGH